MAAYAVASEGGGAQGTCIGGSWASQPGAPPGIPVVLTRRARVQSAFSRYVRQLPAYFTLPPFPRVDPEPTSEAAATSPLDVAGGTAPAREGSVSLEAAAGASADAGGVAAWPGSIVAMARSRTLSAQSAVGSRGSTSSGGGVGSSTTGFSFGSGALGPAPPRRPSAAARWAAADAPLIDTTFDGAASSDDEPSPRRGVIASVSGPAPSARAALQEQQGAAPGSGLSFDRLLGRVWPSRKAQPQLSGT